MRRRLKCRGFTLLEMLAVLAILAVLSAFMVTRLGGRGRARLRQAEDLVAQTDAWARRLAEQRGEAVRLRVDLSVGVWAVGGKNDRKNAPQEKPLPAGVSVERVVTETEDRTRGDAVIDFHRGGAGPAYAVQLRSAADETRWVVFAGGTGQRLAPQRNEGEQPHANTIRNQDVESYFRALRKKGRADAR